MGIEGGLCCSVCGHVVTDILYFPVRIDDRQAYWIETIWSCDPFTDFNVCEFCMRGHCGAVPRLNADNWLEDRIKEFTTLHQKDKR